MKRTNKMLALLTAAVLLTGCGQSGTQTAATTAAETSAAETSVTDTTAAETTAAEAGSLSFTPGTYEAQVDGHNDKVTVQVTFDEGSITDIQVTEHAETAGLGDKALESVAAEILDAQSLAVDTVSGATVSSTALLTAVEDCVTQAGGDAAAMKAAAETVAEAKPGETKTLSADYVVIGSGPAGLSSAVEAAEAGLKVIVFEKIGRTGGAANFGMGPLALGTEIQKQQGEPMNVDEAYNMFMEYTHYRVDGELVRRYFDKSADTIEWLEGMGVEFQEAARYFDKSYPSWHIVKSDDGTQGGGQAATMMRRLTERAEELGVEIYLNTPVNQIKMSEGAACGVMAQSTEDNTIYDVDAKAVLVATGGFGNNVEMIEDELGYVWGEDYFGMKFDGHEGDGLKMAWESGAAKDPVNIEMIFNIYANGGPNITSDVMILMRQPGLLVNKLGQRFFNEEEVQNTTYTGNSLVLQPGNTGYMILTQEQIQSYIDNGVDFTSKVYQCDDFGTFYDTVDQMMAEQSPSVYKAETLDEAAEFFGIDAEQLKKTVEEYNAVCESGKDPMGKSAQYLKAIEDGPYYIAQYFPGSYGTLGGVKISTDLEVLNDNHEPIPGLYSAGTDSCSIFGDSYMFLLPGNTMGYCLNSGRLAAESVVQYLK